MNRDRSYRRFVRAAVASVGMTRHQAARLAEPDRQVSLDLIEARRAFAAPQGGHRAGRARRRRKRILARARIGIDRAA